MLKQVSYKQACDLYDSGLREIAVHSGSLGGAFQYAEEGNWEPDWCDQRNEFAQTRKWFYVIATE